MFEELRGLPPKPEKTYTKKQMGCMRFSYAFFVLLFAAIIGMILSFSTCNPQALKDYQEMARELSIEVEESQIAPNAVKTEDFIAFEQIINSSITSTKELPFFDENHKMLVENMMAEDIIFNNNITLNEKNFACLAADILEANLIKFEDKHLTKDAASVIQINLTTENTITTAKVILKINPEKIFDNYTTFKKQFDLASTFYLICTFSFSNSNYEILSADLHVNQLTDKSNKLLLQLLAGSQGATEEAVQKLCKAPAQAFVDQLQEFRDKYNAVIIFEGHTVTAIVV